MNLLRSRIISQVHIILEKGEGAKVITVLDDIYDANNYIKDHPEKDYFISTNNVYYDEDKFKK